MGSIEEVFDSQIGKLNSATAKIIINNKSA